MLVEIIFMAEYLLFIAIRVDRDLLKYYIIYLQEGESESLHLQQVEQREGKRVHDI
jgi:hypothetical protein